MTKKEKDKILKLLAEDRNDYAKEIERRIASEQGKITGADYMLLRFNTILNVDVDDSQENPKTGYWREVDTNTYACSNCSHCFSVIPEDNSIGEFKYCPNCEAKMLFVFANT